jgi:hypothetical protein
VFGFEPEGEQEERMDQTPSQPQWTPPPQQPTGWGTPGYGGPPPRPTGVTLAAIYLIVMGVLLALGGAACGLLGGAVGTIDPGQTGGNPFAVFGGIIAVMGIVVLVLGILSIAAGAGALGGKGWARWTGVVVSVLMVLLGLLLIVGSLGNLDASGGITSLIFWLIITVAYALTAWALIQASAYFSYRR